VSPRVSAARADIPAIPALSERGASMGPALSPEARLLRSLGQPVVAGLFEDKNATKFARHCRALLRYFEHAPAPRCETGPLYPCGPCNVHGLLSDQLVTYSYSFGFQPIGGAAGMVEKRLEDETSRFLFSNIQSDLAVLAGNPLSSRFSVGGRGFTHSILNYHRILAEGLDATRNRIDALEKSAIEGGARERVGFYRAAHEALDGVFLFHARCLEAVRERPENPENIRLVAALEKVPRRPATGFYEALVVHNFMWYLDGCDSIGRLDSLLWPYYEKDLREGRLTREGAGELLTAYWRNFDANSGWHMILGGGDDSGNPAYSSLTNLCVRTLARQRRPNAGIRVRPDMPGETWDAVFDTLASGSGNPALYNEPAYLTHIPERCGVTGADRNAFAFGGCTELMFEGLSNVGSLDSGINLIEVLDATIKCCLAGAPSFDAFLEEYRSDVARAVEEMVAEVNLNQEYKAVHKPLPIRTLFIDDCLGRGVDYNAGGARYNGSAVNVAGLANAANSLHAIRRCYSGKLGFSPAALAGMLENDFEGEEAALGALRALDKYGNNREEVDDLAEGLADFAFKAITAHRTRRGGGFFLPACLMFVTYANEGRDVDATPDGRRRSAPIADSIGPMQGTDFEGPTSMLLSVASLPQRLGLGTLVLNLRVPHGVFGSPQSRAKLRSLIETYFNAGGLQVQITVVDQALLERALENPGAYANLIVRIGGYTEYFHRLPRELQREVVKRHDHAF
jgi:formate C-acetyltransferase